ncbi:hypothetical protein PV325_008387, partial [Microctonus aethiopoides]
AAAAAAAASPLLKTPLSTAQQATYAAAATYTAVAARAYGAAAAAAQPVAGYAAVAGYGREYADPYLGHSIGPMANYGGVFRGIQASCIQLVMSAYTFKQRTITPIPPEKGSFPLDHEGFCKRSMIKYMRCLHDNKNSNALCRDVAKEYLGCRMDNNLMTREEWSKLGFTDEDKKSTS